MENLTSVAVIIGVVKGITTALGEFTSVKISSVVGVVLAVATGVVLGLLGYFGLTVETGIVAGLTATGVYQVAKKVGGN